MVRQIRILSGLMLCNLCGINEVRFGKDPGKRKRFIGMGILYAVLIVILWGYLGAFTWGMIRIGAGEVVPYYLYMIASLVILCFSFFKAANVIFQMNTYELLISLPVSRTAVVAARFLTMYVSDLLLSLAVMLPGGILYGVLMKPSFSFYLWGIAGTVCLPCLPLAIATAAGSVILAVSSRMRHKNLVSIGLSVALVVVVLGVNAGLAGNAEELEQIDIAVIRDLAVAAIAQIQKFYPPAGWFGDAVTEGNWTSAALLIVVSAAVAGMLLFVLQKCFVSISSALNVTTARQDYKMKSLSASSVVKALWKRELRRYFASSIYVVNTIVGQILMVMAAAGLWIVGAGRLTEALNLPGEIDVLPLVPFVLAMTGNMMPITASSVSMEGKQWWISQTLPVTMKQILDGKILLNLSVAAPFYAVAEVFAFLAVKPAFPDAVWLLLIPLVYTLFLSVAGLSVNLALPIFNWESEVRVVKQSASASLTLLIVFLSCLIPGVSVFLAGSGRHYVFAATLILLGIATLVLYRRNQNMVL